MCKFSKKYFMAMSFVIIFCVDISEIGQIGSEWQLTAGSIMNLNGFQAWWSGEF